MNTPARAALAGGAAVVVLAATAVACSTDAACAATSPRPAPAPAPRPPAAKTPHKPSKPRHVDDGPDLLPLPPFVDHGQCQ